MKYFNIKSNKTIKVRTTDVILKTQGKTVSHECILLRFMLTNQI